MTYENKPGTGALFKNDKKGNDKAPDYRGPIYERIDGDVVERQISAWLRKSKSGQSYMSLQVKDKFVPSQAQAAPAKDDDFDDKIPF